MGQQNHRMGGGVENRIGGLLCLSLLPQDSNSWLLFQLCIKKDWMAKSPQDHKGTNRFTQTKSFIELINVLEAITWSGS